MTDQVFRLREGWFAIVRGQSFGPWPMRGYALAGLQTEQRRAERRSLSAVFAKAEGRP